MINQVTLVGRLTKNPDLRITPDGLSVTNITLAVNRHFRNHEGEIEADFIQCKLWRKSAENTAKFCRKGSLVGVTGRIQTRNYNNHEGKKVYVTEVVVETIRFLGTKRSEDTIDHFEQEAEQRIPMVQEDKAADLMKG
nr:single-stranded DNA-binding protein [uncultured Bacillus sp.]